MNNLGKPALKMMVLFFFCMVFIMCKANVAEANTIVNSVNAVTFATQDGKWLYVKNSEGYLCRVKTDGCDYKKLTDVSLKDNPFILYKNYLYYLCSDEMSGYIYRMKTDGSEKSKLISLNRFGMLYAVAINYIYYGSAEGDAGSNDSGIQTWRI